MSNPLGRTRARLASIMLLVVLSVVIAGGCGDSGEQRSGAQLLRVTPSPVQLAEGGAQAVQASVMYADFTEASVTNAVSWSSSDDAVVAVEKSDTQVTLMGASVGQAKITARYEESDLEAVIEVRVVQAPLVALEVRPAGALLEVGDTVQLDAEGVRQGGAAVDVSQDVDWSSSDEQVASVSVNDAGEVLLNAVGVGEATIAASHADSGLTREILVVVQKSPEELRDEVIAQQPSRLYSSLGSDSPLYVESENTVEFFATQMGGDYTITLENITGGRVIQESEPHTWTLVPADETFSFDVVAASALRTERFEQTSLAVALTPMVTIRILGGDGREVDVKRGLSSPPRMLQIAASPDPLFANRYPSDARYRVAEAEVTLARGSRPIARVTVSERASLSSLVGYARPGDRLVVEVKNVQRKNFAGDVFDGVPFSPRVVSIPIN